MSLIKVDERNKRTNAKQLRRNGLVPCCVYGGNLPGSISIQMSQHAANQLIHTKREGSKVTLELDGRLISTQIKEKRKLTGARNRTFQFSGIGGRSANQ